MTVNPHLQTERLSKFTCFLFSTHAMPILSHKHWAVIIECTCAGPLSIYQQTNGLPGVVHVKCSVFQAQISDLRHLLGNHLLDACQLLRLQRRREALHLELVQLCIVQRPILQT